MHHVSLHVCHQVKKKGCWTFLLSLEGSRASVGVAWRRGRRNRASMMPALTYHGVYLYCRGDAEEGGQETEGQHHQHHALLALFWCGRALLRGARPRDHCHPAPRHLRPEREQNGQSHGQGAGARAAEGCCQAGQAQANPVRLWLLCCALSSTDTRQSALSRSPLHMTAGVVTVPV